MEYNTARNKLMNGEYGRHIQRMIEYAVGIKDRDLRNQQAQAIVKTMSCFSPGSKDTQDYWNKLWDQLIVMSNFKLDIDSPFPKPVPEKETHPQPLPYPKHHIYIRTYGLLIEKIIKQLTKEEMSAERDQAICNIANYLKKQYLNWNRDSVSDTLIIEHLANISNNKLKLKANFKFSSAKDILADLAANNNNNGLNVNKKKKKKKKSPIISAASASHPANNRKSTNKSSSSNTNNRKSTGKPSMSNMNNRNSGNRPPFSNNNRKNNSQNKQQKS
jgi:hypothetical protein